MGVSGECPAVEVDLAVVGPAQQDHVIEVGVSAGGPVGDVVGLAGVGGGGAAGDDAAAVWPGVSAKDSVSGATGRRRICGPILRGG